MKILLRRMTNTDDKKTSYLSVVGVVGDDNEPLKNVELVELLLDRVGGINYNGRAWIKDNKEEVNGYFYLELENDD